MNISNLKSLQDTQTKGINQVFSSQKLDSFSDKFKEKPIEIEKLTFCGFEIPIIVILINFNCLS